MHEIKGCGFNCEAKYKSISMRVGQDRNYHRNTCLLKGKPRLLYVLSAVYTLFYAR